MTENLDRDHGGANELGRICFESGLKIAVAESMTAGLLSDLICSVSGASGYFLGGLVCYTPKLKAKVGVGKDLIDTFGVYSEEVAAGLASGSVTYFDSDIGVGVTGVAEPDDSEPVPGAWVAVAFRDKVRTLHVQCGKGTGRNDARKEVARKALGLVLEVLGDES